MDLLANELLGTVDEDDSLQEIYDPDDPATPTIEMSQPSESGLTTADSAKTARTLRRGLFKAASLQDKLLEK